MSAANRNDEHGTSEIYISATNFLLVSGSSTGNVYRFYNVIFSFSCCVMYTLCDISLKSNFYFLNFFLFNVVLLLCCKLFWHLCIFGHSCRYVKFTGGTSGWNTYIFYLKTLPLSLFLYTYTIEVYEHTWIRLIGSQQVVLGV